MSEHDFEPIRGLPGELPKGERLLWQASPDWWGLAQRAFHMRSVALYFGLLMVGRAGASALGGADALAAIEAGLQVTPLAIAALVVLAGLALLTARTTVYTITSKRVVLRFGVALPKAINIPFTIIETAAVKNFGDKSGDLAITLIEPNKIAYLLLWPHARPWKLTRPQPSMRAIANASSVAAQLAGALKAAHGDRGAILNPIELQSADPVSKPQGALSPA